LAPFSLLVEGDEITLMFGAVAPAKLQWLGSTSKNSESIFIESGQAIEPKLLPNWQSMQVCRTDAFHARSTLFNERKDKFV
jgi:hypothetical protein